MFRRSTFFLLLSMPVNLNQYRGVVGVFNCKYSMVKNYQYHYSQYTGNFICILHILLKSCQSFSICHWNLNSISAHNFTKLSLLQAYNSVHNYDITCLSETYLNSSVSCDDDNLEIPGYNLIHADHPSDNRRGGVCVYYKNTLPLKLVNINYLQECLNFEIKIGNKYVISYLCIIHLVNHRTLLKLLLITLN